MWCVFFWYELGMMKCLRSITGAGKLCIPSKAEHLQCHGRGSDFLSPRHCSNPELVPHSSPATPRYPSFTRGVFNHKGNISRGTSCGVQLHLGGAQGRRGAGRPAPPRSSPRSRCWNTAPPRAAPSRPAGTRTEQSSGTYLRRCELPLCREMGEAKLEWGWKRWTALLPRAGRLSSAGRHKCYRSAGEGLSINASGSSRLRAGSAAELSSHTFVNGPP